MRDRASAKFPDNRLLNPQICREGGQGCEASGLVVITFLPRTTVARQANCTAILPRGALYSHGFHRAFYCAAGDVLSLAAKGMPDLARAIAAPAGIKDPLDMRLVRRITPGTI
jgi:hypothetical protein